jgi:hypothetical protein
MSVGPEMKIIQRGKGHKISKSFAPYQSIVNVLEGYDFCENSFSHFPVCRIAL